MKRKKEMKRLSAGQISSLLFYRDKDIKGYRTPEYVLTSGKIVHNRLGYDNTQIFKRYYYCKQFDEVWLITGMPDKLEPERNTVVELKTYGSKATKQRQIKAGEIQVQVYCFITGLENWELHFFNSYREEMEAPIGNKFRYKFFKQAVDLAIELQKRANELAGEFVERRKTLWDTEEKTE